MVHRLADPGSVVGVPQMTGAVAAAGGHTLAVVAEGNGHDRPGMMQLLDDLGAVAGNAPQSADTIPTAGQDRFAIGTTGNAEDLVRVEKGVEQFVGGHIPDPRLVV